MKTLYRTFSNTNDQHKSLSKLGGNAKPQLANLYKTSRLAKFNYSNSNN